MNFRKLTRLSTLCLVASLTAFILCQYGFLARFEIILGDEIQFINKTACSDRTVLVVVDKATVEKVGKYPFDRAMLARVLDILHAAGANRVYVDASLSTPEDASADDALEAALARFGPERVALPVNQIGDSRGPPALMKPLERFARHAALVTTDLVYDLDMRIRRVSGLKGVDYRLSADWLNDERNSPGYSPIAVNFSNDPATLTRFGLLDVAEGRTPPSVFQGKNVIVGLQLSTPQFTASVPIYWQISRVELIALALETLQSHWRSQPPPIAASFPAVMAMTLALAPIVLMASPMIGLIITLSLSAIWPFAVGHVQRSSGVLLPVLAPPLAALILWQTLRFGDSRLGSFLKRRRAELVGLGQSALLAAVGVMTDPAAVFDARGRLRGANAAFEALGADGAEAGRALIASDAPASEKTPNACFEISVLVAGEERYLEATFRWIETLTGKLAIVAFKDVTKARRREAGLALLAFRDALTRLANRAAFHARLDLAGKPGTSTRFGVLLIDLDGFKQVNDGLGHHAGDLILVGFARRIEALLRSGDLAARLGGDEFAILVESGDPSAPVEIAARILMAIEEPFDIEGRPVWIGASIGVALWPDHHADVREVLKLADAAMYVAKRAKPAYALHSDKGAVACRPPGAGCGELRESA